jgi:hypothetical protein
MPKVIKPVEYAIGKKVRFTFQMGNVPIFGTINGYGYNTVKGFYELRVKVHSGDLPSGNYRASFWKIVEEQ